MNIPIFNDFIYTILYNATAEEKQGLSGRYLTALKDEKQAAKFIETATREEKEYLLAHFGFQFLYVICPEKIAATKLKDFIKEQQEKGYSVSDLRQQGFYAHTDKEIIHLLGLAAKAIHNPNYFLNLEINRQGYHVKKWSRQSPVKEDAATKEVMDNDNVLMRTLLSSSITMNYQPGLSGLSEVQLQILLFMYINRQKYISYEDLNNLFAGYKGKYKEGNFASSIRALVSEQLIQKSAIEKDQITITGIGIKKCIEYRNAVLANNNL
jgi:hypothetical protein